MTTSSVALPFQLSKTLACALSEMQAVAGVTPEYFVATTLNSKYNNFPTTLPTAPPKISLFGIGINGYKNLNDSNLSAPYIPSASDLDLYTPLPFRVVPVTSDLAPSVRANYRMRILQTINGVAYWCYYLKLLSFANNQVQILSTNLTTGVETPLSTLDPLNLNPVPSNTTSDGTVTSNTKTSVALTANLSITGAEVIEAINILYGGNLLQSKTSEIGIYTANDQIVSMSDGAGGTFSGNESIYTQLAYHYTSLPTPFGDPTVVSNKSLRINSSNAFLV